MFFSNTESYFPTLAFLVVLHFDSDERFAPARSLVGDLVLEVDAISTEVTVGPGLSGRPLQKYRSFAKLEELDTSKRENHAHRFE